MDVTSGFQVNVTVVANDFIDRYMAAANGEYIKVYLVRAAPSARAAESGVDRGFAEPHGGGCEAGADLLGEVRGAPCRQPEDGCGFGGAGFAFACRP